MATASNVKLHSEQFGVKNIHKDCIPSINFIRNNLICTNMTSMTIYVCTRDYEM